MKIKKHWQIMSSFILITPLTFLTTACNTTKKVDYLNTSIAKGLNLYDQNGNSLVNQYLYNQFDENNKSKFSVQIGTNQFNFNTLPDFNQNNIMHGQYDKYPELLNFVIKTLKIPENSIHNWAICSQITIKIKPQNFLFPSNLSLQYNKTKSVIDFYAPATTCEIEFYNKKTKVSLAQYKIKVAGSFLNIANNQNISIDGNDIIYTNDFFNVKMFLTAQLFNRSIQLKNQKLNAVTIDTIELAKLLQSEINLKVYNIDQKRLLSDNEELNLNSNYGIAFTIKGVYIKDFLRIGKRTDHSNK